MLIRGVIEHEIGDNAQPAGMGGIDQGLEICQIAVGGMHAVIIGDVVAVIDQRRGEGGEQPDAIDAQVGHIIETGNGPAQVAMSIAVAVVKSADVEFVENRSLIPLRAVDHGNVPVLTKKQGMMAAV